MINSGTTINLFGNPNIITNRKIGDPHGFSDQSRVKIVDKVGEINGAGQK